MKKIIFFMLFAAVMFVSLAVNDAFAEKASDITRLIDDIQVGEAVYYEGLTIIPVYSARSQKGISFITLEEAFNKKYLEVTEMQGGRVPQVKVTNNSDKYIYLMGGEILTGCKQDRIVGRDVLIGSKSRDILVTVYCVEHGRWTNQSGSFYSKGNLGTFEQRGAAQCEANYSSEKQQSIWDGISRLNRKMKVSSETSAYQAAYDNADVKKRISSYERKMSAVPLMNKDTLGVVIGIGERIVSVDIFADSDTFKALWPKLLKSSALAAINCESRGTLTQDEAARFLRNLHDKDYAQKSGVDEGIEFSVVDNQLNVNALVFGNTVIHIAAFPQGMDGSSYGNDDFTEENGKGFTSPIIMNKYKPNEVWVYKLVNANYQ